MAHSPPLVHVTLTSKYFTVVALIEELKCVILDERKYMNGSFVGCY